jgi:hypothetical protein
MAEYQLLRCAVALAGDKDQIVYRHRHDPILFPELIVLQYIHGEDAVTDVHVIGTCEMAVEEAWTRLLTIYGEDAVKAIFPGARPMIPRFDDTLPLCNQPIYMPEPTRPASPDPKLRPLDKIAIPVRTAKLRPAPAQPIESEPTADEIAAHAQDEDEPVDDAAVDALADDLGLGVPSKPTGKVLAQGRPGYPGQTANAGTPGTPDVGATSTDRSRTRTETNNSHRRAAGMR